MSGKNVAIYRALSLCAVFAASCVRESELARPVTSPLPPPAAPAATQQPTAAPADRVAATPAIGRGLAASLDTGELIVGQRLGLEAWRADGSSHRTLSAGSALHPRRFGRDHVIALRTRADDDLRDGAVLELISLQTGERRALAELPAFRCAGKQEPARLQVQGSSGFEVDSEKRVACFELADGGSSAKVRVRARIDLAQGTVKRWLAFGELDCAAPEGVTVGDEASDGVCWRVAEVARELPHPTLFPFSFDNEHVRPSAAQGGGRKLQVRGYEIESISGSNRWLLLAGDYTEREATYRRLLLLDRSRGTLFPVSDRVGPWPPALSASGTKLPVPVKQAQSISSAADVRWLGTSEDTEVLVLNNVVIKPGRSAFQINDAELAR